MSCNNHGVGFQSGRVIILLSVFASAVCSYGGQAGGSVDHDMEIIRARVIAYVMRPSVDAARVEMIMNTMDPGGYWPNINYKDVSRTGFQHSQHLANMLQMARAYKNPGHRLTGNEQLKKAVHTALDFWIAHDFRCENWWWNDMGTPLNMINLMLVMDTELTEKQREAGLRIAGRAHMKSAGARPGGDLIRVATMWGKQGLFMRNSAILEEVVGIIASEMKTTTGRGLKPDLSHHHRHDNVISTLSYGLYLPSQFSLWGNFVEGTRFSFPKEATELLVDFFLDGICRSMVDGRYPDPGARNRGISRMGALRPAGADMAEDLWRISHHRRDELKNIADIRRGRVEPDLRYTSFFWHSEYFIHQRPSWFASVRMHSSRNHNMEYPHNEEGLKNHHYGDGSNFLTVTAREYDGIFPVWDWQRIPGITVVRKPAIGHWNQIAKRGRTAFVGGITDGEYGAAAFDFESPHDPLRARKAWFFFDDEYVCLGSGISSTSDHPVNTILSQRYLEGDVSGGVNGATTTLDKGEHQIKGADWVSHGKVAYVFPEARDVCIRNASSTGSWRSISHQMWASDEKISADVFALWFDHGVKPRDDSYEYIVVPGIEAGDVNGYRGELALRIVSNTASVQAVRHEGLGITQMVFYDAGEVALADGASLSVDKPCMVMVRESGGQIVRITVSDPSRRHKDLEVSVGARVRGSGEDWKSVWDETRKASRVVVSLPRDGLAGKSVVMDVN